MQYNSINFFYKNSLKSKKCQIKNNKYLHYYHFATILELIKIMYNFYYKNLFKKFPRRLIPLKFLIP